MLRKPPGASSGFDDSDFASHRDDKSKDVAWGRRQLLGLRRVFHSPVGFVVSLFVLAVLASLAVALSCTMLPRLWAPRTPGMAPAQNAFLAHRHELHDKVVALADSAQTYAAADTPVMLHPARGVADVARVTDAPMTETHDASASLSDRARGDRARGVAHVARVTDAPMTETHDASASLSDRVRGLAPALQDKYHALMGATGGFACLDGSLAGRKTTAVVNDDFCECADGSDEPGTAACAGQTTHAASNNEFFCAWSATDSSQHVPQKAVRISVVNDGICDCCGGEDEFESEATCPNRCGELVAEEQASVSKALLGARARQPYAEEGLALKDTAPYSSRDGGPDGTFHAFAKHGCLKFKESSTMSFELCLFEEVKQLDNSRTYILGKQGKWSQSLWEDGTHRKDYSRFIMGDGEHCHASQAPRRAEIIFECAEKDELVSVREAQICVYELQVRTPAACAAEHHEHH